MPTLESLTEANINQLVNPQSLKKGRSYLHRIRNPQRMGNSLSAQVSGSRLYNVEIEVDDLGVHAHCTCPYDWDGYCKHIGAVLLRWMQSPGDFIKTEAQPAPPAKSDFPIEVVPVKPPATFRPDQPPFWLMSSVTSRQQAEAEQLAYWLELYKVQELRDLAKKRGWSLKGTKKAELAQQLIGPLLNPAEVVHASRNLDAEHAQVFRAMILLGSDPGLRPEDMERVAKHWGKLAKYKQLATYLGHLGEMGLAIPGNLEQSYPLRPDFVSRPLIRSCPPPLEPVIASSAAISADIPGAAMRLADPLSFIRKTHQLILMLEQNPPPLRPPQPRPKMEKFYPVLQRWDYDPPELAAINTKKLAGHTDLTLSVPPPEPVLPDEVMAQLVPVAGGMAELDFMLALLTTAGVFQPGSPVTVWPEVKEQFFRQTEPAQRATLTRTYFVTANWNELWEVLRREPALHLRRSLVYGNMPPDYLRAHLTLFRHQVLRLLACLPDNRWVKVANLAPLLQAIWPRFDQTRWEALSYYAPKQKPGWYLARRNSDEPLTPGNTADWQLAQWNFVIQLITRPLHWLGLVDLYESNGQPIEIRLHGLADLYWDRVEAPDVPHPTLGELTATSAEAVTIEGETITINPAAVNAQLHGLLDSLARLDEVLPDRFVYTLNAQAVHAAFEAGLTLAEVVEQWAQLMPHPMPEHLRARLEEWWHGYGQVRLYENVTVIEFSDDYALAEMKAVTSLAQHLIAEISPRLVLIPAEAVDSLTAELEKAGYTPQQADKV